MTTQRVSCGVFVNYINGVVNEIVNNDDSVSCNMLENMEVRYHVWTCKYESSQDNKKSLHWDEKSWKSLMTLMEAGSDLHRTAPEKLKALCPKEALIAGRFS